MRRETKRTVGIEELLSSAGLSVAFLLDAITDSVAGKSEPLRDGSEHRSVDLPRDLYAHESVQTEWWYYTGHLRTETGRQFGFELVFFKRRTDLDRFGPVPLRLIGNPIHFAHFALTDHKDGRFRYAHRKSKNGLLDLPAFASENHYFLKLGDWTVRESRGSHILSAAIGSDISFEATLTPRKPVVLNGSAKDGVSFKDSGEASRYFSYTRMEVEGEIVIDGKAERIEGSAWMDREFGTWTATEKQKGWDWFSIQLDNDIEVMCYQLRDGQGNASEFSSGVIVAKDGTYEPLSSSEFDIEATGYWRSPSTSAVYPSGWRISIPSEEIELNVAPVANDQELDTRGTTMVVYWEGACVVEGIYCGSAVNGKAYVELVGYDRSHDNPNLAYFLMGDDFTHPR